MDVFYVVEVKISRLAIPTLKAFYNQNDADNYAENEEKSNPLVRWVKVHIVQDVE